MNIFMIYIIINSITSVIILTGIYLEEMLIIVISIMIKVGMFPYNGYIIEIYKRLSLKKVYILGVVPKSYYILILYRLEGLSNTGIEESLVSIDTGENKFSPVSIDTISFIGRLGINEFIPYILSGCIICTPLVIMGVLILNIIISTSVGLIRIDIKNIVSYSSIVNIGLVLLIPVSVSYWYWVLYVTQSIVMINSIIRGNIFKMIYSCYSLIGVPPLLGFSMK